MTGPATSSVPRDIENGFSWERRSGSATWAKAESRGSGKLPQRLHPAGSVRRVRENRRVPGKNHSGDGDLQRGDEGAELRALGRVLRRPAHRLLGGHQRQGAVPRRVGLRELHARWLEARGDRGALPKVAVLRLPPRARCDGQRLHSVLPATAAVKRGLSYGVELSLRRV